MGLKMIQGEPDDRVRVTRIRYSPPDRRAEAAVPFLASLGPAHNGKALMVPDV